MKTQVNKTHYNFNKYVDKDRWMSYYYQIGLINKLNTKNILEIGAGINFLKKYFSDIKINYKTLDIAKELNPDILGSVTKIPLKANSFDLVCAFQVLEHLPFNKFEKCLKEMLRVAKKDILISLPYNRIQFFKFELKIPLIPKIHIVFNLPLFFKKFKFDGEHYWEIGAKGYSLRKIKKIMGRYFKIKEIIHPYENKYHLFFILEINKK